MKQSQVHAFQKDAPVGIAATVPTSSSPWNRFEKTWNELQVGRQGKYSIERLESFHFYCESTSRTRVILVCILTPMPALLATILLECLPLRSPTEGWAANWVFWIRMTLTIFLINFTYASQLVYIVPGFTFALIYRIVMSATVATGCTGFYLLLANGIGFPVPFTLQISAVPIGMITPAMMLLLLGRAPFTRNSVFFPYLVRFFRFCIAHMTLVTVYPLFKTLSDYLPMHFQFVSILALPFWKIAAKHFVVHAVRELEDLMPEFVAFLVDFFSTLFLSVTMYNSGSMTMFVVIIASDMLESVVEYREVRENASEVTKLIEERRGLMSYRGNERLLRNSGKAKMEELMALILSVAKNPAAFAVGSFRNIRLRACVPHVIPAYCIEQLDALRILNLFNPASCNAAFSSQNWYKRSFIGAPTSIAPVPLEKIRLTRHSHPSSLTREALRAEGSKKIVVQGLQLLFHSEYITLVKYIECMIPIVFVVYKLTLVHLPNVVFYPDGVEAWGTAALANIMVFSGLEIICFALLIAFMQRKFAFSPLYQLAFVLETQFYLVQAQLFFELMCLMTYKLDHLGNVAFKRAGQVLLIVWAANIRTYWLSFDCRN